MRAESKRVPKIYPYLRLSYSIETSLKLWPGFLKGARLQEENTNHLVKATRNNAIEQFAMQIRVFGEEQDSLSITSQDNNKYSYDYGAPEFAYDWGFSLRIRT